MSQDGHVAGRPVGMPGDPSGFAARIVLALTMTGVVVSGFVAGYLVAYRAFIKFSPNFLATLAVPFRLAKPLEFAIYVATYFVLLPASLWCAHRYAGRIEQCGGAGASVLAAANLLALVGILAVARIVMTQAPPILSPQRPDWVRPLSGGVLVGLVVLVALNVLLFLRPVRIPAPASWDIPIVCGSLLLTPIVFLPHDAFHLTALLLLAIALFVGVVALRLPGSWELRASRRALLVGEALALVGVALVAWDTRMPAGAQLTDLAHYWNVDTGPANALLHGGTMLVNIFAQYGVGSYYLFAAIFALTSPGYGTFVILIAVLDTLLFLSAYVLLRLAGVSRLFSLLIVAVATLTSILSHDVTLVNRGVRLLLPLWAIICVQLRQRYPQHRAAYSWGAACVLAVTSIWAAEVFYYALAGALAGLAASFRLEAPEGRSFIVDRKALARIAVAVVTIQVVFALATRAFAGAWPRWLTYLEFQHYYASGGGSQATRPFGPGVLLGVGYFVSACACIALLAWARPYARTRNAATISLAAVTASSIAFFSYMVGEAEFGNIHKMAPLAVVLAGLWLNLLLSRGAKGVHVVGMAAAVAAVWCVGMTMAADRAWLGQHIAHTALYPPNAIDDLRHAASEPAVTPESEVTERFIVGTSHDGKKLLILLPDYVLPTEMLMRLKAGPLLPISDPYEEDFLPSRRTYLKQQATKLPVGTMFVTLQKYFESSTPMSPDVDAEILGTLKQHYAMGLVATGPGGLRAYRLIAAR